MESRLRVFIILLIFIWSCKPEKDSISLDNEKSQEELYFADYQSPRFKWGYINKKGEVSIQPKYDEARDFSENLAAVNYKGKWGYININGNLTIKPTYRAAFNFYNNLALVQTFSYSYYFIDKKGSIQLGPFTDASDFSCGRARLKKEGRYTFIDTLGKIMEETFDEASNFNEGYAIVTNNMKYNIIDTSGNFQLQDYTNKCYYPSDGKIKIKQDSIVKFYRLSSQDWVPGEFKNSTNFYNGYAAVKKEKWYLIDNEGIRSSDLYDNIMYAGSNRWLADLQGKYGIINNEGDALTAFEFDIIYKYNNKVTGYHQYDNWGVLNIDGVKVTPAVYPLMWEFTDGLARVIYDGRIGFIDSTGNMVIPPKFFEVKDFAQGMARVQIIR
jgi:hypothetical protein